MVYMTFLKKINLSVNLGQLGNNNTELFLNMITHLYKNKILFNGYVTNVLEIVEFSLGEIKRNMCNYIIVALFEVLSLSPGDILEDCTIDSIEEQGNMIFLNKYDHNLKIMMSVENTDISSYVIGKKIDIRIRLSSLKYKSSFANIFATPINYSNKYGLLSTQSYTINMRQDGQLSVLHDNSNIDRLFEMRNNIDITNCVSVYQAENTEIIQAEIQKLLRTFYPTITVIFLKNSEVPSFDRISSGELTSEQSSLESRNTIQVVKKNIFDSNFSIIDNSSRNNKIFLINYIVSGISFMSGDVYILYMKSSHPEEDTHTKNDQINIQFMNNYINKMLNAYYTEDYVVKKKLNWSDGINATKEYYNSLVD